MKKIFSIVLSVMMLISIMATGVHANSFSDFNEITNREAVEVTTGLGLFAGIDGKFLPNDNVTRAQMATIVVKMLYGSEINANQYKNVNKFSDVADYERGWAEGYVNLLANLGLVSGYGDGTYKPGNEVTTAEAVTMIINAIGVDAGNGTWPLTVMAKAEEMKLFEDVLPKPNSNEALTRDQLAGIVFNGLQYSPEGNNGYKVRVNGKDVTFDKYSDALLAATSLGTDASAVEEIVGEDTLANKTFEMKTATGLVTANHSTNAADYTTIGQEDYNIVTGLDLIGHYVTVYYKDTYKNEKNPGTTYAIYDECEVVTVNEFIDNPKDFKAAFGSKQLTVADEINIFDNEYNLTINHFDGYQYVAKTAVAGTYVIYDNAIISYLAPSNEIATTVTKVTTIEGKESITLSRIGTLNNNEDEDIVNEYSGIEKNDNVIAVKSGENWTLTKINTIKDRVTKTYTKDNHYYIAIGDKTYELFDGINYVNTNLVTPTDFDVTYEFYVTNDNKIVNYTALEGVTDLKNIVYVVNVYMVNDTDNYGSNTYTINAQGVTMEGKVVNYLLASYKTENNVIVPTVTSGDKSSALETGTMGKTFEDGTLIGDFVPGFYTFKKNANSKLAEYGIMTASIVDNVYDKNNNTIYAGVTDGLANSAINSKTKSIHTSDGTAYLSDTTKYIIYDGINANLTATVTTGKLYHTFTSDADILLTRDSDNNKTIEAIVINKDPDEVSNGEFYYVSGHSYDYTNSNGDVHNFYNEDGKSIAVTLDKGTTTNRGFYKYSVNADGVTTLTEDESSNYAKSSQIFETCYNGLMTTNGFQDYDASGAVIIDVRDDDNVENNDFANYRIDDMADLVSLMNDDDAPTIILDAYVNPDAETVSVIFIVDILESGI